MPNNLFYKTGITTYIWLLGNNKAENRKGKVQLIDGGQLYRKLWKTSETRTAKKILVIQKARRNSFGSEPGKFGKRLLYSAGNKVRIKGISRILIATPPCK